ncbi:triacylglycerol lipase [Zopfochytrium polystomum]|nr:triacylglycerol lipase [Zopfochytrium polystomum]
MNAEPDHRPTGPPPSSAKTPSPPRVRRAPGTTLDALDMNAEPVHNRPAVTIRQGTVLGVVREGNYPHAVETFLGIPYCLPPTGDRRFRPPVRVPDASPDTTIDASQYGPRQYGKQLLVVGPELVESEDSLTANVFRQAAASREGKSKLPVAVYIHGGAFNRSSASMHNTTTFVGNSAAPIVCVSFNYRLGSLGFLPSALSEKEGALNLGLKDQIMLLEWVQENIEQFGGDPRNVTLIGLSAGAHSIGHHLLNYDPDTPPLFHRVVMESGNPTSRAVRLPNAAIHEQQFRDFLDAVNCPRDLPSDQIFPFLRTLPATTIAAAQTAVFDKYNPSLRWAFQPCIDGAIVRGRPIDAWRQGRWHKVPMMVGFNTNEGSIFVDRSTSTSAQFLSFFRTLFPGFTDADLSALDALYPDPAVHADSEYVEHRQHLGVGAQYKRIEAAYGQFGYSAPMRQTADFAARAGVPVYLYHWALDSGPVLGAQHAMNILYETMDPLVMGKKKRLDELARNLHAYIVSFVCCGGDPNALVVVGGADEQRPMWPAFRCEADGRKLLIFGKGMKEHEDDRADEKGGPCQVIDDVWAAKESQFWWDKSEISQE